MALILSGSIGGSAKAPLPKVGVHVAVCIGHTHVPASDNPYGDRDQKRIFFHSIEGGEDRLIGAYANLTLGNKEKPSKLRKIVESCTKTPVVDGVEIDIDERIIGKTLMINVVNYVKKDGKDGVKVESFMPLTEGVADLSPNYSLLPGDFSGESNTNSGTNEDSGKPPWEEDSPI